MKKRSAEVLERILANKKPLSIHDLAMEYGTSEKTIRNDVRETNQFLTAIKQPEIIVSREGLLIRAKNIDIKKTEERLYTLDAYEYKLSGTERQLYIAMLLLESRRYMTMQALAEELLVSRITIVNDMEPVKEALAAAGVDLILDPGKGMVLNCGEYERLYAMAILCYQIREDRFFQAFLYRRLRIDYTPEQILSASQDYMRRNHLLFAGEMYYKTAYFLFVLFNFADRRGTRPKTEGDRSDMENLLFATAEKLEIILTGRMQEMYLSYIRSFDSTLIMKSVDDLMLYKVIIQFVSEIDKTLNMGLANDMMLLDSLLMHIRNMYNWEDFEVELPIEEDSSINYDLLMELVDQNSPILEKYLIHKLNDSLKKTIVIHICVAIIRSQQYMAPVSVLLVCPGSRAGGKYLEAQIKQHFDFRIAGILTEDEDIQLLDENRGDIEFVLSTIPLLTEKYTVLQIHPFLGLDDLNMIQRAIFHRQRFSSDTLFKKKQILRNTIDQIFDDKALAQRLLDSIDVILAEYSLGDTKQKQNALASRLQPDYVLRLEENRLLGWEEAIRISAQPLLENGCIAEEYVERAIQVVREYGDYIVIGEGVALAHANQNHGGVFRDCLSLLACPSGILFTESGQTVHLMFCFASTGQEDDLDMLKAIIQIGKKSGEAKRIASLPNEEDIFRAVLHI